MLGIFKISMLALAVSSAQAAPFHTKRIAQTISDSTQKWQAACLTAGGGDKCNPLSVTAFSTLLAAAGPCDQQNAADQMIDLAKQLNSNAQMIALAQVFCQQPRNTPTSQSVPYCQQAPKNSELSGLFQCQFAGANTQTFVGGIPVGSPGTIPLGHSSPLSPPGSCPANPNGPIPDGQQLVDITQNPGVPGGNANTPPASGGVPSMPSMSMSTSIPVVGSPAPTPAVNSPTPTPTPSVSPSQGNFKLQNGQDAQKLNAQFATLTANSSCTDGQISCVTGEFAQCVNGKFVLTQCSSPLICAALPLVNSPGTSVTCTTQQDAITRIANTGAQGGLTGSG
ncbi:proline-rich protein [Thelephora terrestris]|uniref:Proline-rich protein n=1 Tax=Thelephora terrestris TaxID=56493 RepID=A0A9P6L8A7_9AGAM|nr:proline-rich protein [Thelephora terrestris]